MHWLLARKPGSALFITSGRHARQDWGGLSEADKMANEEAITSGGRILSAYLLPNCTKVWVITEAWDDLGIRAATTLLVPEEY